MSKSTILLCAFFCQVMLQWWGSSVLPFVIDMVLWWMRRALTSCHGHCSCLACSSFIWEFKSSQLHLPSSYHWCWPKIWSTQYLWHLFYAGKFLGNRRWRKSTVRCQKCNCKRQQLNCFYSLHNIFLNIDPSISIICSPF